MKSGDRKLLIFDCDGVLFDTASANLAYFNQCLNIAGHPPVSKEHASKVQYMSVKQLIDLFIPDRDEAVELFRLSQTVSYDPYLKDISPFFEFENILIPLSRKGFRLAVATNRGRSIDSIFWHFGLFDYFDFKISTLNAKPKPDPEMIEKCLDYFYLKREQAIFIGDSISDYECSQRAGIEFIWFGKGKPQPHAESGVDLLKIL